MTLSLSETSHGQTRTDILNFSNSFATSSSFSFLLATKIRLAPFFANSIAVCFPIPDDAPVIRIILFLKSTNKKNHLKIKWFLICLLF